MGRGLLDLQYSMIVRAVCVPEGLIALTKRHSPLHRHHCDRECQNALSLIRVPSELFGCEWGHWQAQEQQKLDAALRVLWSEEQILLNNDEDMGHSAVD